MFSVVGAVVAAAIVLGVIWLSTPLCVPILDAELPAFETVLSLKERAARGEPFEKKDGHWYQCKSRLVRLFFF
jgi:hypothetical protein